MSKCSLGFDAECSECGICPDKKEKVVPKLSKRERMVCELLETGWITRDNFRSQLYYQNKFPHKDEYEDMWLHEEKTGLISEPLGWLGVSFEFITWEDEKPWSIEDLLKLEVETPSER